VIITGGNPVYSMGLKVEVFNINANKSCRLDDLPGDARYKHSHCGHLLCGGESSIATLRSCLKLNHLTGDFSPTSVRLKALRATHSCWDVEGENGPILLMGGQSSPRSTELVSSDGSSSSANANFTLKDDRRLYSRACGMKTQDKFVITGGDLGRASGLKTVTRYSRTGQPETLPQLNVGRWDHACGSYLTDEGDTVLLVTGGLHRQGDWTNLDSTEILEDMAGTWRLTSQLPSARGGLRAASVENNIFVFGGNGEFVFGGNHLKDILRYNKRYNTWEEVGQMKDARKGDHAVAVLEDVSHLCS